MMRRTQPQPIGPTRNCGGFTLIEAIIVIVVLAIAAVTVAMQSGRIFDYDATNTDLQVGMPVLQECAEQILTTHRAGKLNTSCRTSGNFVPSVTPLTYDGKYTGPVCPSGQTCVSACPTGSTCTLFTISVLKSDSVAPAPITLLVVDP